MAAKTPKCACNWGMTIVTLILFALGLYTLIGGISAQWSSASMSNAGTILGWYFVAFVLFFIGKMAKWKAHGDCPAHGMGAMKR